MVKSKKTVERAIDIIFVILAVVFLSYLVIVTKRVITINYKSTIERLSSLPQSPTVYFEGSPQLEKKKLSSEHNIFLGDLDLHGVDPLSFNEFENGVWEASRVSGFKSYYKDGSKLSISYPIDSTNYIDAGRNYQSEDKKYRDLLLEVNKPLEFVDEKKKLEKEKKTTRWGKRNRREEKQKEIEKEEVSPTEVEVEEVPLIVSTSAADLHSDAISKRESAVIPNASAAKIAVRAAVTVVGREREVLEGIWADEKSVKMYIVSLRRLVHDDDCDEAMIQLDMMLQAATDSPQHTVTWVEVRCFEAWYGKKDITDRETIRSLVTSGHVVIRLFNYNQIEFALAGWTSVAHSISSYKDAIDSYEHAQRWLLNEFNYRCSIAYAGYQSQFSQQMAAVLREGGVDMLVLDGVDETQYEKQLEKGGEFLWETDAYLGDAGRLFTHISGSAKAQATLWDKISDVINANADNTHAAVVALKNAILTILQHYHNGNRFLLMWNLDEHTLADLDVFLTSLSSAHDDNIIAKSSSLITYLQDVHNGVAKWPVRQDIYIQAQSPEQWTGLYTSQPFLHDRLHQGSCFLDVFEQYYAYCSVTKTCTAVPAISPDAFFSNGNYYPTGKAEDNVFYRLYQYRHEQAAAQRPSFIQSTTMDSHYSKFHSILSSAEYAAGKMMTSLIGINERVSPNEVDDDSLFSIYHRTLEWNQKKEVGVIVFNHFSIANKDLVRLRVATPDLCVFNSQTMKMRQQMTPLGPELFELTFLVKLQAYAYASFILRWCDGTERDECAATTVKGRVFDGDAYRVEFDASGRFTNVTNKLDDVMYRWEHELAVMTISENTSDPITYIPHGLPSSDPLTINPYLKRLISPLTPLSFSALRGPLLNIMVQRYSEDITVITRIAKSIGVNKKQTSRGLLIDMSYIINKTPIEGDLVAYNRFEDIASNRTIHTDSNGRGTTTHVFEEIPSDTTSSPFLIERNHVMASTYAYIQDEDLNSTVQDITRLSMFFDRPRGISSLNDGSLIIPLITTGESLSDEKMKKSNLNKDEHNIAWHVQRSDNGIMSSNDHLLSLMISQPSYFMYYNNTKENKLNRMLRLNLNVIRSSLPANVVILSYRRIDSISQKYLLRLQNIAERDDVFNINANEVTVSLESLMSSLMSITIEEVTVFGVSSVNDVEMKRLIWMGDDDKITGGVLNTVTDWKNVVFYPLQIRSFLLTCE